jgi:GSH-dependent disulfide-bond oxidoreductase
MITLHTWTTPNGYNASIMLEEIGAPYTVKPVNLAKGEQHAPNF